LIEYTGGPAAIGVLVSNVQRTLPVFASNARRTPSPPPAKPTPPSVVVTPPRSGSDVRSFETRLRVFTSIALIEPWSYQPGSGVRKLPFCRPRNMSPSVNFRFFCVGVSCVCTSIAAVSAAAL
jgi:hypothetical protein